MLRIQIIIGSTRQGRFGDKPARFVLEKAKEQKDAEFELLDLRDWSLPFFDEPVSPGMFEMTKKDYTNDLARKWAQKIGEGDGYIIVTPEYNHGPSAVLKNALDYVYKEWNKKPVAFFSYGGSAGGTRAVQQLRQIAIELQMVPIRAGVHLVNYWEKLDEKGNIKPEEIHGVDAMLDQLIWFAKILKTARK